MSTISTCSALSLDWRVSFSEVGVMPDVLVVSAAAVVVVVVVLVWGSASDSAAMGWEGGGVGYRSLLGWTCIWVWGRACVLGRFMGWESRGRGGC